MRLPAALAAIAMAATIVGDTSASTVTVRAGDDLQQVLNTARPGDTIQLEAGATFTGNFVLPARTSADDRNIVLRTVDGPGLPGEGERIGPGAAPLLARLQSPNGSPALQTVAGTRHWKILLLEFAANRTGSGDIIALGDGTTAQNALDKVPAFLVLDRLYIHGDPVRGQKRGIALNSSDTTITGSHISDIKTIGQDSQAIAGWNGPGRYLIANNYLEAASENVMFGGADPSIIGLTPTTIVVRRNLLTKPLAWREAGVPNWQVKNLLELKNARDVLIEQNVLEHSWQAAQSGYAVLFTVRNQSGGCGWCQVEDVTFRLNVVRGVAGGVSILGTDNNSPSRRTTNIRITDNLFADLDKRTWGGDGFLLQLSDSPKDVLVDHNTVIQGTSGGLVKIANGRTDGFVLTNNLAGHGDYGIIGSDHGIGNDSITTYLPGAKIVSNVIAGGSARLYPPGNQFPSMDEFRREFEGFAANNYTLGAASRWRKAGSDGRDLGADLGGELAAQRAVPRNPGESGVTPAAGSRRRP